MAAKMDNGVRPNPQLMEAWITQASETPAAKRQRADAAAVSKPVAAAPAMPAPAAVPAPPAMPAPPAVAPEELDAGAEDISVPRQSAEQKALEDKGTREHWEGNEIYVLVPSLVQRKWVKV